MLPSKQIKTFNCLRCNREVIDGEEGMLELGLCFNCIYWQQLLEEESNAEETSIK